MFITEEAKNENKRLFGKSPKRYVINIEILFLLDLKQIFYVLFISFFFYRSELNS